MSRVWLLALLASTLIGCQSADTGAVEAPMPIENGGVEAPTSEPTETPFALTTTPSPTATASPTETMSAPTEAVVPQPTDTTEVVSNVQVNGRNPDGPPTSGGPVGCAGDDYRLLRLFLKQLPRPTC